MLRRDFFTSSLGFAAGAVLSAELTPTLQAGSVTPMRGEMPEEHLTAYLYWDVKTKPAYQAWVRRNNTVLLSYRAFSQQKYPFIYPVAGPVSGKPLTTESSVPWPQHCSLNFSLDKVNDGNFFQGPLEVGQVVSQGISLDETTEQSCKILDHCLWAVPGKDPIAEDTRIFHVKLLKNTPNYIIDTEITMKVLEDVKIGKSNHGFFGVRVDPDLVPITGGNVVSSEGATGEENLNGKPARWVAFYGKRSSHATLQEGIAILTHPKYPDPERFPIFKNCRWLVRDFGRCSPTPFAFIDQPCFLPKNETLHLKYRVVAFAGTPKEAGLDALWEDFAKTE